MKARACVRKDCAPPVLGAHDEDAHRDAAHQPAVCARVRASQYVRLCVSLSRWLAPWVYVYVCGPLSLSLHVCEPLNRCTCVSLVRRSLSRPRAVSRSPLRSPRRPKSRQQPAHCQNCECGSERGRGHSQQAEGGAAPKRGFPLHPRVVAENTTLFVFSKSSRRQETVGTVPRRHGTQRGRWPGKLECQERG